MNEYYKSKAAYSRSIESATIVNVELVSNAIDRIDHNKAPGFNNLTIEHLVYAHPSIIVILSKLFNILLYTGLVPDDFGIGVTTPIPKFKDNKRNISADDFRAITICPVISKLIEHCLMINFVDIKTSDRQFGFKKNVGCNNSIHTVRKVINYFNNRKTTVNIGIIDLRKAFDKVNVFGLLCLLQEKNINVSIINIIENWFCKNVTTLKWGHVVSHCVPLLSGVKQGGILSPLLFSLFVNKVLEILEKEDVGCFIANSCCNSYMYADALFCLALLLLICRLCLTCVLLY